MINSGSEPSGARYAELVAPVISRVFVAGMAPEERLRHVVRDHAGPAVGFMIDLRNPLLAGRPVSRVDLGNLYRYSDPDEIAATMAGTMDRGLLSENSDGYRATAAGIAFLRELFDVQGAVLVERWGSLGHIVRRLNETLAAVLTEADRTAGPSYLVQAPPYEPTAAPIGLILLNRLSTLRHHRADAHATAWQQAGMTAAQVQAEPWGAVWSDRRKQVEQQTNVLAGGPFAVLGQDDRLQLLADLGALP